MKTIILSLALLTAACGSASADAQAEIDTMLAAQANASAGRLADNGQRCEAYTKLQKAYLAEHNDKGYASAQLYVTAYC